MPETGRNAETGGGSVRAKPDFRCPVVVFGPGGCEKLSPAGHPCVRGAGHEEGGCWCGCVPDLKLAYVVVAAWTLFFVWLFGCAWMGCL